MESENDDFLMDFFLVVRCLFQVPCWSSGAFNGKQRWLELRRNLAIILALFIDVAAFDLYTHMPLG